MLRKILNEAVDVPGCPTSNQFPEALKRAAGQSGFTLFALTWAIAGLFHQLSFLGWRWYSVPGGMLTAAIIAVLLKPSSWMRFATLLIVDWFALLWKFPYHPNHIVFAWVVNSTMLLALVLALSQKSAEADVATRWHRIFAPWLRVELCILYFFAIFHKLNVCYFNPELSCAVKMYHEIAAWIPLLPDGSWADYCAIYGTLIIETAIPMLLLGRRTRVAGALLGMLFHGFLALHSHGGLFSFSATMTALYSACIPVELAARMKPGVFMRNAWRWGLAIFAVAALVWFLGLWLSSDLHLNMRWLFPKVGFVGYFLYLAYALILFVLTVRKGAEASRAPLPGEWRASLALVVFPILLLANGFGPYFGLRTETSFSMFSNLHTENGHSNHLIMPASLQMTDWQSDLVHIVDSNDPKLLKMREEYLMLPYLELRRLRTVCRPGWRVTYLHHGVTATFDAARPETQDVLPPLNRLARRYFYFRPVEHDPFQVRCRH